MSKAMLEAIERPRTVAAELEAEAVLSELVAALAWEDPLRGAADDLLGMLRLR